MPTPSQRHGGHVKVPIGGSIKPSDGEGAVERRERANAGIETLVFRLTSGVQTSGGNGRAS